MEILDYILLFSSVIIGGGLAFYLRRNNENLMQLILSFSGAYILGITFLHLVPETYEIGGFDVGLYVLLGFFIQLLLEQLSKGVEHGHIHALHSTTAAAAFAVMIGLCLHSFIEGMPLSGYMDLHAHHGAEHNHNHVHDHMSEHGSNHLLWGIILHKIPAAFALGVLLLISGFKDKTVILYLAIFGMMSPLGAGLGVFLKSVNIIDNAIMVNIMGVVIGSFLHIATTILFETDTNHKIPINKLIAIAIGLGISLLTMH